MHYWYRKKFLTIKNSNYNWKLRIIARKITIIKIMVQKLKITNIEWSCNHFSLDVSMRQLLRSGKLTLRFSCLTFVVCSEVSNEVGDGRGVRDQVFVGAGNTGLGTTVVFTTIVVRPGVSLLIWIIRANSSPRARLSVLGRRMPPSQMRPSD